MVHRLVGEPGRDGLRAEAPASADQREGWRPGGPDHHLLRRLARPASRWGGGSSAQTEAVRGRQDYQGHRQERHRAWGRHRPDHFLHSQVKIWISQFYKTKLFNAAVSSWGRTVALGVSGSTVATSPPGLVTSDTSQARPGRGWTSSASTGCVPGGSRSSMSSNLTRGGRQTPTLLTREEPGQQCCSYL